MEAETTTVLAGAVGVGCGPNLCSTVGEDSAVHGSGGSAALTYWAAVRQCACRCKIEFVNNIQLYL
jgi:hypothetical protein